MKNVIERIKDRIPSFKYRMTRISIDIGAQIFEYMKNENLNQKQLAAKLGKKESEISKWLNGSHNFTIETIAKIEDVFDKDIIIVPMFAKEDLGLNFKSENSENIFISFEGNIENHLVDLFVKNMPAYGFGVLNKFENSENVLGSTKENLTYHSEQYSKVS